MTITVIDNLQIIHIHIDDIDCAILPVNHLLCRIHEASPVQDSGHGIYP